MESHRWPKPLVNTKGPHGQALVSGAIAVLLLLWYLGTGTLPRELVEASPYITTPLVLTLFAQRLRAPKAIGKPYRGGEGT